MPSPFDRFADADEILREVLGVESQRRAAFLAERCRDDEELQSGSLVSSNRPRPARLVHDRSQGETVALRDTQGRLLATHPIHQPGTWSLDAVDPLTRIAFLTTPDKGEPVVGERSHGLLQMDLDGEKPNRMWTNEIGMDRHSDLAPSRSFVAWESFHHHRGEIQISPMSGSPNPHPVSTRGGANPRFSKDSQLLYFIGEGRSTVFVVDLAPTQSPPFSTPRPLFDLPDATILGQETAYDTLPGGGFLVAVAKQPPRLQLIVNWLDEVDALLDDANVGPNGGAPTD